jgi:hypothetical protein
MYYGLKTKAPKSIFLIKKNNEVLVTTKNVKALLDFYGIELRYNVVYKKIEYSIKEQPIDIIHSANYLSNLTRILCRRNHLALEKGKINEFLTYLARKNLYNPLKGTGWLADGVDLLKAYSYEVNECLK